jgi:hypothetical protein
MLNEAIAFYIQRQSPVFCTFWMPQSHLTDFIMVNYLAYSAFNFYIWSTSIFIHTISFGFDGVDLLFLERMASYKAQFQAPDIFAYTLKYLHFFPVHNLAASLPLASSIC